MEKSFLLQQNVGFIKLSWHKKRGCNGPFSSIVNTLKWLPSLEDPSKLGNHEWE